MSEATTALVETYRRWGPQVGPKAHRSALGERAMALAIARIRDEATVQMLEVTSSAVALAHARYEERVGLPVYDSTDQPDDPRAYRAICAAPDCTKPFWVQGKAGDRQRYCSNRCCVRAHYYRQKAKAA